MYYDLIKFPIKHENLKWEASEALLDIRGIPHLFSMIKLTGTKFPQRAQIAQVWVGRVHAKHVLMDENCLTVRAYFDAPLPKSGDIYFGVLGKAELKFEKFVSAKTKKLDRMRFPENTIFPKHLIG